MSDVTLALEQIQGGILRGYGYDSASLRLVRITDADAGRAWLGALAGQVTTALPWRRGKPDWALNVALTAPGLEALGVALDDFPDDFRQGMAHRAEDRLGDVAHNAPGSWEDGLKGRGEGHVLVWVHHEEPEAAEARAEALVELLGPQGGDVVFEQRTALLEGAREHFGFADGFAQPSVAGSGQENRPGEGVPEKGGRWRLLRPGEVILGYEDEDGLLPAAPRSPLDRNATFMVLRKLEQDVAAWEAWLDALAPAWAAGDREWLAAKVVGRWRDGTPLALAPERPQSRKAEGLHTINAFGFGDDRHGARCPLGAHIRRVNPREGLPGGGMRTRRHRIIRRGMPYGPAYREDPDASRGLLFGCFNASIARQFEVVQGWSIDGNLFGLGPGDRDFFAGADDGATGFTIPGVPPMRVPGPGRPFVTVRGGEYLYVPSLEGLGRIAQGTAR